MGNYLPFRTKKFLNLNGVIQIQTVFEFGHYRIKYSFLSVYFVFAQVPGLLNK